MVEPTNRASAIVKTRHYKSAEIKKWCTEHDIGISYKGLMLEPLTFDAWMCWEILNEEERTMFCLKFVSK